jgi:ribonuclease T2
MINRRYAQALGGLVVAIVLAVLSLWSGGGTRAPEPPTQTARDDAATPSAPASESESRAGPPAPVAESNADFDYYLLVLSWSPTHCSSDAGHGSDDDLQCRSGRPFAFVLHGLWPQNERGYPQDCASNEPRDVSDDLMKRMLEVSPSRDLVQHEWQKHGTCSGLSQSDFVSSAVTAFRSIQVPPVFTAPARPIMTTPDEVRRLFVAANNGLEAEDVAATCSRNELAELWVCLDRQFRPRACSAEVQRRHCGSRRVRMLAVRGDWPRD